MDSQADEVAVSDGGQIVQLSNIWDIYEKCKNDSGEYIEQAKCIKCKKILRTTGGNTSTLHSHARRHKFSANKRRVTEKPPSRNGIKIKRNDYCKYLIMNIVYYSLHGYKYYWKLKL
jgi:ABC-type Fe3+/spermidine/putrescine transport system ATPase subunit